MKELTILQNWHKYSEGYFSFMAECENELIHIVSICEQEFCRFFKTEQISHVQIRRNINLLDAAQSIVNDYLAASEDRQYNMLVDFENDIKYKYVFTKGTGKDAETIEVEAIQGLGNLKLCKNKYTQYGYSYTNILPLN